MVKQPLRKIVRLLDGQGKRGQSLVEMTLTFPIFALLLFGMIEIGWFANNYLTLLDITREAGRYGATIDPINDWDYPSSAIPDSVDNFDKGDEHMLMGGANASCMDNILYGGTMEIRYYVNVACRAYMNMPPLVFKFNEDQIVVSVISYKPDIGDKEVDILARYPNDLNECGLEPDPNNPADESDGVSGTNDNEPFIGYAWPYSKQNHEIGYNPGCYGSEFNVNKWADGSVADPNLLGTLREWSIWHRMNDHLSDQELELMSPGAMVTVEIFWQHYQLLGLPFFSVLANPTQIHVWTIMPNSAAEPTPTPI